MTTMIAHPRRRPRQRRDRQWRNMNTISCTFLLMLLLVVSMISQVTSFGGLRVKYLQVPTPFRRNKSSRSRPQQLQQRTLLRQLHAVRGHESRKLISICTSTGTPKALRRNSNVPQQDATSSESRRRRESCSIRTISSPSCSVLALRSGASDNNNDSEDNEAMTPPGSGSGGPGSRRSIVLAAALTALATVIVAAKVGLFPGPPLVSVATTAFDGSSLLNFNNFNSFNFNYNNYAPYTDALIIRDVGATLLTAVLGTAFVQIVTWAATPSASRANPLQARDARKIIHTLSAPLFILFWPVFSDAAGARIFCAIVPMINGIRLYTAASGQGETSLAAAVSRSGNVQEAGGGPFIYVCVLAACILLFWRDQAAGIVALSNLSAGDGLADLVGRRLGENNKWPGLDKSVAGTIAFWLGATACSVGLLLWMQSTGNLMLQTTGLELVATVAAISGVAALLELVPFADDNYTVPVAAGILTMLFLH